MSLTDYPGFENPTPELPGELVQEVMAHLPYEDRGRWSQADKALQGFTAAAPHQTPAGQIQGINHRVDLAYRTIYTQEELEASLDDPAPLHFAPGGGPQAQPLVLKRGAAPGRTIQLYGGLDQVPLALMREGGINALDGAVVSTMRGGYIDIRAGASVTDKHGGVCTIWGGGTVVNFLGGGGHCHVNGTIVNKSTKFHVRVQDGTIENLQEGPATLHGASRCSSVHGGTLTAMDTSAIGVVHDGLVTLRDTASLATVLGGDVDCASTIPIDEVCGGIVNLYAGAGAHTVTGGTVHAHSGSTVGKATGGILHLEDQSVLHHAEGDAVIQAGPGCTVTLYADAHVDAYDHAVVIAYGGTVHLHGTEVQLTDYGATIIQEP